MEQIIVKTSIGKRLCELVAGKLIDRGAYIKPQTVEEKEKARQAIIERERAKELASVAQQRKMAILDETILPPVWLNGQQYMVLNGKYVPIKEAELIIQELRAKKEAEKLEFLQAKSAPGAGKE